MDFIIGLFFLWIIFNVFSGFTKKAKKPVKATCWTPSGDNHSSEYGDDRERSDQAEFNELKARVQSISKQQAVQFSRRAALKRGHSQRDKTDIPVINPSRNRDVQDKNIHRREDWGSRAGPGVLSSRNILILLAVGLVLMLLSQIPSHLLR